MNEGTRFDLVYETMPWHKVDTVVFDIGNVLIRFAPDDFLQQLFPVFFQLKHAARPPFRFQ